MELCDLILTLDLTNFNYTSKTGAVFTVKAIDKSQEETTAPTEEVSTTEEPTEVPTTTVPETTVAPETTAPVPTTEPVPGEAVYVVAGSEALCGVNWVGDPEAAPENVMTKNGDVYTLTFADAQPGEGLQIKVVENLADGTQNWIGDETGNNITFNVTDVCDVTVTFNPATNKIEVTGENVVMVTDLEIEFITAVGNGDGNWLNGIAWDPADRENEMEMISDKVYQIRFNDIEEYDTYQVKFAANGSWTDNWGGVFAGFDVETEAVYNSNDNITVDTTGMELCDLILTLDLTNFDYTSKTGAVFTVKAIDKSQEETTAPTEEIPTTEEPTEAPTTEAPTEPQTTEEPTEAPTTEPVISGVNVKATSNICSEVSQTIDPATGLVTVTYYLQSNKNVLNTQWTLTYDNTVLKYTDENNTYNGKLGFMPVVSTGELYNTTVENQITGGCSDLALYDFSTSKPFVQVTFEIVAEGNTTVDLFVDELRVGNVDPATGSVDESTEENIVVNGMLSENAFDVISTEAKIAVGGGIVPVEPTTVAPTTVAPTTVAPTTEAPTTEAPTTEAPTDAPATDVPTTEEPTVAPATDATSATGVTTPGSSTSDTPKAPGTNSGAVQTGNASMAIVILLVLVSATGVMYFTRKRSSK